MTNMSKMAMPAIDVEVSPATVSYDPNTKYYNMNGEKLAYIIRNLNVFDNQRSTDSTRKSPAVGSYCDMARLQETFGQPGRFKVNKPYEDLTRHQIMEKLKEIGEMDHKNTSCIAIVLFAYETVEGEILASDASYSVNDVMDSILYAPNLAGKPKLFLIQICRNRNEDDGLDVFIEGGESITIPTHSDMFMLRSVQDICSSAGSSMIQTLCDVMDAHYNELHILQMTTVMNSKLEDNCSTSDFASSQTKPIPLQRNTLTKLLKF